MEEIKNKSLRILYKTLSFELASTEKFEIQKQFRAYLETTKNKILQQRHYSDCGQISKEKYIIKCF